MPSTQNDPSDGTNPGEIRLDSALDDYLLAKSKANETGNYRRNAERVLTEFLDWAEERGVETFDALDVADLEAYALALNRRTTGEEGIAATSARKYYDYVRAYLAWCASREYATENPAATDRAEEALPNDDERDEHHQQLWSSEQRQVIMRHVEQRAHDAVDEQGHGAIKETRDRAFVATIAYAGVRGGEIVRDPNDDRREGVRWSDLELENATMTVLGKGDQAYETVGLPRQALSALERTTRQSNHQLRTGPSFRRCTRPRFQQSHVKDFMAKISLPKRPMRYSTDNPLSASSESTASFHPRSRLTVHDASCERSHRTLTYRESTQRAGSISNSTAGVAALAIRSFAKSAGNKHNGSSGTRVPKPP